MMGTVTPFAKHTLALVALWATGIGFAIFRPAQTAAQSPTSEYLVYVASEASDSISLVRFGPNGGRLDHVVPTGIMPTEIDGPHGLAMSPDHRFYYVSLAHGQPFGSVWKYSTTGDAVVGRVTLGMFPATLHTTPDGEFLYAVNFNLHGDMVPSSVSVVATGEMVEVARIPTCIMPHGSRISPQGTRHYSVCMMDDVLVEIDTSTLKVSRHFIVTKGAEKGAAGPPQPRSHGASGHDAAGHGLEAPNVPADNCSPTWAQPSHEGNAVFVACNASNEILEIDAIKWTLTRRIAARSGVYNLAVTRDQLVATNKRDQSVSVIETASGRELARIPTKRRVVHGVVVSPDDRYAFVSVEGIGAEPGTVEMIDLRALKTIATVDVAPQAAGIDFYKIEQRPAAPQAR
jgi:DNA-binding beta-propeller fold protein YncE